jgi:hypothetical protein
MKGHDLNGQGDPGNDGVIALAKSLGLDDQSSGETCRTNGCEPLDGPSDNEFAHLKVRVHLRDNQAILQGDGYSDDKPAVGRRMFRTVAVGLMIPAMLGAAFAWQFYGDQAKDTVRDSGTSPRESSPAVSASFWPSNSDLAVELASKTLDRTIQDTAILLPAPVLPSAQVPVAPGSSPEQQDQFETLVSDVAVVRRFVERLAAVQEQMALDIATLQKSGQNVRQKMSLPPHSPAAVPPRKYVPSIARSDVVAHSPSVPVPTARAQPPLAPH